MKYSQKMKLQEATKMKSQKRRVVNCSERPRYTDEEIAKLNNYGYNSLLDMIYYKLEQMQYFFLSKDAHIVNAKRYAKQMGVAMQLIEIANGRCYFDQEEEPYVNMNNVSRFGDSYSPYLLRKEKAWHVLFMYLECKMRNWWD